MKRKATSKRVYQKPTRAEVVLLVLGVLLFVLGIINKATVLPAKVPAIITEMSLWLSLGYISLEQYKENKEVSKIIGNTLYAKNIECFKEQIEEAKSKASGALIMCIIQFTAAFAFLVICIVLPEDKVEQMSGTATIVSMAIWFLSIARASWTNRAKHRYEKTLSEIDDYIAQKENGDNNKREELQETHITVG